MSIAAELREARQNAGMSQRALARAAGVPLSTVGRIERGLTAPRFDTLEALADALDADVRVTFTPRLPPWLEDVRSELLAVCLRHGATRIEVFGSVARNEYSDHSDLDLLVDLEDTADLLTLVRLERELSELVGCPVDVIPRDSLTERFVVGRTLHLSA